MPGIKKDRRIFRHLDELFDTSPAILLLPGDKWIVLSDLHIGDGSGKDDFKTNAKLFIHILKEHYLAKGYKLVLNGDIEELQRFTLQKIIGAWPDFYWLLDTFYQRNALYKTIGNHDMALLMDEGKNSRYPLFHALKLIWKNQSIFIYHGHQASNKYLKYNKWLGVTLKYIANPLRIKNFSVAHNSRKQYKIEKKAYHYSSSRKIISIIGHTHRPLFESLSKTERLRYKIEEICRRYINLDNPSERKKAKRGIKKYKKELIKTYRQDRKAFYKKNIYNTIFTLPSLFNSGCGIGKRGISGIEMQDGKIRLIHWFDKKISKKYLKSYGFEPEKLHGTDYYRMVINEESLDYIFSRIQLLS